LVFSYFAVFVGFGFSWRRAGPEREFPVLLIPPAKKKQKKKSR
jgi:hypothetical protein